MTNKYEIIVERKVRETYTVLARTRTEAAIAYASADFESLDEMRSEVVDERVMTPRLVDKDVDQLRLVDEK